MPAALHPRTAAILRALSRGPLSAAQLGERIGETGRRVTDTCHTLKSRGKIENVPGLVATYRLATALKSADGSNHRATPAISVGQDECARKIDAYLDQWATDIRKDRAAAHRGLGWV